MLVPRGAFSALAVLWLGLACGAETSGGIDEADPLFAPDGVPVFELMIPADSLDGLRNAPLIYRPATLRLAGATYERVGVRLKGRASFETIDEKASFKIKVDEFVPGRRVFGLRRFTLNNAVQDPTWARERLAYLLYRTAGLPAPRCNSARVVVNGEPFGIYTNVETLDDEFVESRFGKPIGNLWDTSNQKYHVDLVPENRPHFERETTGVPADGSDLSTMLTTVAGPEARFMENVSKVLDWDEWLLVAGVQAVVADWDGFFGATNNYELYSNPATKRFVLLPWGQDQTFGKRDDDVVASDYGIDHETSERPRSFLLDHCLENATCRPRYVEAVRKARSAWDRAGLTDALDAIDAQLASDVRTGAGRSPPSSGDRSRWMTQLRRFLSDRPAAVDRQLARIR